MGILPMVQWALCRKTYERDADPPMPRCISGDTTKAPVETSGLRSTPA